jgi:aldehyde dehydrogenase (NAD+)
VREVGKPITEARGELARAVAILRFYAQVALDPDGESFPPSDGRSLLVTRREPRGVVGLITPWNFPVAIPLWKLAPALAYGNVCVWKPSEHAPACAAALFELLRDALPEGVVELTQGAGEAGAALVAHPGSRRSRSRGRRRSVTGWRSPWRSGARPRSARWAARTRPWCWRTPTSRRQPA